MAPRPSDRLMPVSATASRLARNPEVSCMPKSRRSFVSNRLMPEAAGPEGLASYGRRSAPVQVMTRAAALAAALLGGILSLAPLSPAATAERAVRIVALGDSLTAGFGLPANAAFPVRLEKALAAKGLAVEISNAGVSGDTMSGGLARLDWSVPEGTDAVILELGANDMLRGIDPQLTRHALEEIVRHLTQRHVAVLLAGMRAAANFDSKYRRDFDAIYPELAVRYDLLLYPFFLDGIAGEGALNQGDGLHPSAAGVDAIVVRILPTVEELVRQARSRGAR